MLQLRIAQGCGPTGRTLANLIRAAGHNVSGDNWQRADAVVCWGTGYTGQLPSLNRNAGRVNKLEELRRIQAAGLPTPALYTDRRVVMYPALGRQLHHHGGTDIKLALEANDVDFLLQQGAAQFFTGFVPSRTEYRFWVYRRRHLGAYEKVLAYPQERLRRWRVGRNYANGYAFRLMPEAAIPREGVDLAARTVDTLGLDFGAVDVLHGQDGRFYVLECNSAPGVEGEGRQVIQALARKIARWAGNNYPRRNGDLQ